MSTASNRNYGNEADWISVKDRLPGGDCGSVLIFTPDGGIAEGQYYPTIAAWKQFRWSVENAAVTHWMPLPSPPEEIGLEAADMAHKRQELVDMLSELDAKCFGDEVETYTTGYRNGHRNGQIELLRYILQIPDGTSSSERIQA